MSKDKPPLTVRPHILFPNDQTFNSRKSDKQEKRFKHFLNSIKTKKGKLLIIELGINENLG